MRLRACAPAVVLVGALLSGCGGDEPAGDPGPTGTPSGASSGASSGGSSSGPPSGSPSPTSTVEPASGIRLELPGIAARAPEGWELDPLQTDFQVTATTTTPISSVTLFQVPDPSGGEGGLREAAEQSIDAAAWLQRPRVLAPTEVDGVEVYHVAGRVSSAAFVEEFGATVDGQAVSVQLLLNELLSAPERRELVEAVLATVRIG